MSTRALRTEPSRRIWELMTGSPGRRFTSAELGELTGLSPAAVGTAVYGLLKGGGRIAREPLSTVTGPRASSYAYYVPASTEIAQPRTAPPFRPLRLGLATPARPGATDYLKCPSATGAPEPPPMKRQEPVPDEQHGPAPVEEVAAGPRLAELADRILAARAAWPRTSRSQRDRPAPMVAHPPSKHRRKELERLESPTAQDVPPPAEPAPPGKEDAPITIAAKWSGNPVFSITDAGALTIRHASGCDTFPREVVVRLAAFLGNTKGAWIDDAAA